MTTLNLPITSRNAMAAMFPTMTGVVPDILATEEALDRLAAATAALTAMQAAYRGYHARGCSDLARRTLQARMDDAAAALDATGVVDARTIAIVIHARLGDVAEARG